VWCGEETLGDELVGGGEEVLATVDGVQVDPDHGVGCGVGDAVGG